MGLKDSFSAPIRNVDKAWAQLIDAHNSSKRGVILGKPDRPTENAVNTIDDKTMARRALSFKKDARAVFISRVETGHYSKEQALNDWLKFCQRNDFHPFSDAADTPEPSPIKATEITPEAVKPQKLKARKVHLKRRPK